MQRALLLIRERPALAGAAWLFVAVNVANVLAYLYQVVMLRLLSLADFAVLVSLFAALIVEAQGIQLVQNTAAKVVADRRAVGDREGVAGFAWQWGRRLAALLLVPSLLIALASPLVSSAVGFPPATVVMLGASLFFAGLFAFCAGLLQGLGSFGWLGGMYIAQAGARLLLGVLFVAAGFGLVGAFAGPTLAIALSLLAALLALRGALPRPAGDRPAPAVGGLFAGAAVLLFFYALQVNVDALLAPALLAPAEAGSYAAAVTMGKIALFAPLGLSLFLLERTATAHALGLPTRRSLYLVLATVLAVSGSVALAYLVAPELAARIVAGDERAAPVAGIVGTYGVAALSNALLNVWAVYFVGIGRLRVAGVFLVAVAVLVAALTAFAREPLAMARIVLAVTLATQVAVVAVFVRSRE